MNTPNDGGPAFPVPKEIEGTYADPKTCTHFLPYTGMTLRDYFAAAFAHAAVEDERKCPTGPGYGPSYAGAATRAYLYADAMIAARANGKGVEG